MTAGFEGGCVGLHIFIQHSFFGYHFYADYGLLDFDTARAVFKREFDGVLKCTIFIIETSEKIQAFSPDNKDAICVSQVKC